MYRLFIFILASFGANAQNYIPLNYDTLQRTQELNFFGSGEFASTAIANSLTSKFLFGGEISSSIIEKIDGKHKNLNRIGFYAEPTLEYANYNVKPFKKQNWGIIVKAGAFYSGASRYRSGVFGLAFRGNEPYLGTEIDLSNMSLGIVGGHKIGFGFIGGKNKSSVTLNIYGITNYIGGYLNDSHFKQDETGFNAELYLNGRADMAIGPYYKGLGVGIDANLFFKIGPDEKPSFIQFSIQNLGVGFINNVARYSMDTTILYDGYTIADITNGNTLFGKDKNLADEIGLSRDTVSKAIALPFTVQIGKIIDEHNTKTFQMYFGGRMYAINGALPMVYIGGHYRSKKWFRLGIGASYGGFTGFRVNMYAQGVWKQFNFGISTSDVVGMIGFGKGYGYSLNLNYRFTK